MRNHYPQLNTADSTYEILKARPLKDQTVSKLLHRNPEQKSRIYEKKKNTASHKVKFTMSYIQSNILTKHAKRRQKTGPIGRRKGNQLKMPRTDKDARIIRQEY